MAYKAGSAVKRLKKRSVVRGVVHVSATFNNTIVTLTDVQGNAIVWGSAGGAGFKGARKSTPYAAQMVSESVATKGKECGVKSVEVRVKGLGGGRESALRALQSFFEVVSIRDVTLMPRNGCRLPKRRRI